MKLLKIAVIQMDVKVNEYTSNMQKASSMIDKCAEEGAKLICLSEAFATSLNLPKVSTLAQTEEGEICSMLCCKAKEHGVYIVGGFIEKNNDKIYSSAMITDTEGKIIGKYRRRYIFDLEKHFLSAGSEACFVETAIGKIGIIMGYDINFPESCRDLFRQGVEIIVCPTQIPKVYKKSTKQIAVVRATENNCYFVLASSTGKNTIARLTYMGGSLIAHSSTGLEDFSTQYLQQQDILESCDEEECYIIKKVNMTQIRREIEESPLYNDFIRGEEKASE